MKSHFKLIAILAFFGIFSLTSCQKPAAYITNDGYIFGSTYHIVYQSSDDLADTIVATFKKYNSSLSTYDSTSIISRVNKNDTSVLLDNYFVEFFNEAQRISNLTNGAFDITVAPLVNAWGFGFKNMENVDSTTIKALLPCVGYQTVQIKNNRLVKQNPCTMLDANALGPGQAVDLIARLFDSYGVKNYMIEVGGEVRALGVNPKKALWRIGIDKPIESNDVSQRELQEIVNLKDASLATSGNYRAFYEKDGIKYSHTINPTTGFPARSSILSASVITQNCISADAFATAFMVLGVEKTKELIKNLPDVEVYLIYSDSVGQYQFYITDGFKAMIAEN